jgi:type VI secretion system protein ImpC
MSSLPDEQENSDRESLIGFFLRQLSGLDQIVSRDVETNIKYWIAEIDKKLSAQLNEVMHHPDFQWLEATWRGLQYLVDSSEIGEHLKVRVLNASKRDLVEDLGNAVEFDQSALFNKLNEEYRQQHGEPYGMLVGDYEFDRDPEDVALLRKISQVAAAAHAPFVAAASPAMFGFGRFTELTASRDLAKIFQILDYVSWKSFRQSVESRYAALTLPRVLARMPYGKKFKQVDEFDFEEAGDGTTHDKYLWMNAAWAYAARVTDAYAKDGWFARTGGIEGGGKVQDLPVHTFPTDDGDVAMKCPTEIAISDRQEFKLSNLGFLPLLHCKNRDCAVFMCACSCHPADSVDAELTTELAIMLCAWRFAHYLKVMLARHKMSWIMDVKDSERWLNDWINSYCCDPDVVDDETRARKPLEWARVELRKVRELDCRGFS